MSKIMSQNKLKKSYTKVIFSLNGDIRPLFSEEDYVGKHLNGQWLKYPFKCVKCGHVFERVLNRVNKIACPSCDKKVRPGRQTSWEILVTEFKKIHGDVYLYTVEPVKRGGQREIIQITCPKHGIFEQSIRKHKEGNGCPECSGGSTKRLTKEIFIQKANFVGKNYDYSKVEYTNNRTRVLIRCERHGDFYQIPDVHLRKKTIGCPKCAGAGSIAQSEILNFVKLLVDVPIEENTRSIITPYELDIFIPSHKLAIEYNGLYWHSEANGVESKYHLKKHIMCEEKGIRLISIFEDEWKYKKEIVEATLRHFLGKSERGYFARKVNIEEINSKTAISFLDKHHLLGFTTSKYKVGAFYGDELIAVMTFGTPSDERGSVDTIEMKRFVTDKRNHPGLGSKMFKWAIDRYDFDSVIAFVDRRWFTGSFKFISGFKEVYSTNPTLYWTDFKNRYKRRFITKSKLLENSDFSGKNLTKKQMMNELGYYRIWDCGKIKLRWTKDR